MIETNIERITVEIDGAEYEVAEKTIEVAEKLIAARAKCIGRAEYHLWLAELEILLGKNAVRELFKAGKKENLDRMERIHAGVLEAFEYNHDQLEADKTLRTTERLSDAIAPINELFRRVKALENSEDKRVQVIRRPEDR